PRSTQAQAARRNARRTLRWVDSRCRKRRTSSIVSSLRNSGPSFQAEGPHGRWCCRTIAAELSPRSGDYYGPILTERHPTSAPVVDVLPPCSENRSRSNPGGVLMTPLYALWLPILASAVIVYLVSTIIHMALPGWHKNDFPKLPNEDKAMDALRPLAIPPGDYCMPRPASMQEMKAPEYLHERARGPVVTTTVRALG